MKNSLQDQLLKSGLVDEKKLKQHKRSKKKQARQQDKGSPAPVDEIKLAAQRSLAEQAEQDRQRNRELEQQRHDKAIAAQIVDLIKAHRIGHEGGDVPYQFSDGGKIKKLRVTTVLQNQLARGQLAIVRLEGAYAVVPATIAEKIQQRDDTAIVALQQRSEVEEDDPYADYPIPDDLMW